MNNALLYFGGLLALVLAALFGVPYAIDWNGYRGAFEEQASKVLGRDVRVGGAVNVRFLPTPFVRFEKVRLADVSGQTGEPFIRVESFTMRLAISPLMRGVLEANEIELNKPVLSLAIDETGNGNWASLKLSPADLPFVPRDVTLHSVKMIDGVVQVSGPGGANITRLADLNGDLAADSLDGPFKFKGTASWGGDTRDIRFVTTTPGADGSFGVKASARGATGGHDVAFDGTIANFADGPRFSGEVTGAVPLVAASDAAGLSKAALAERDRFQLRAAVAGDAKGAKFENISIELANAAEPQIITGTARAEWSSAASFNADLNANWLDLDRLAGGDVATLPLQHLQKTALATLGSMAGDGSARVKLAVAQFKLGGENSGALSLDVARDAGVVEIKHLKCGLPGGGRLDVSGKVRGDAERQAFEGDALVRGPNFQRFKAWLGKSGMTADLVAEGPFFASGAIAVTDDAFEFKNARAEIGGQALSGDVRISSGQRRHVTIAVAGSKIDTGALFPAEFKRIEQEIRGSIGLTADGADGAKAPADGSDVTLHVTADELLHAGRRLLDVDAAFAIANGTLSVPDARFATESGLKVRVSGTVAGNATAAAAAAASAGGRTQAAPETGKVAYEFSAPVPAALIDARDLFGMAGLIDDARLKALKSADLGGLLRLGVGKSGAAELTFDGRAQAARMSGRAVLDGGLTGWRTSPSRITAVVAGDTLASVISAVSGTDVALTAEQAGGGDANVAFATSGTLAEGALTSIDIKAKGFDVAFLGHVKTSEKEPATLDGKITLATESARDVLALAGVAIGPGPDVGVQGTADVSGTTAVTELSASAVMVGTSRLGAELVVKRADGARAATIEGDVTLDRVSLLALIAPVMGVAPADDASAAANGAVRVSMWPSAPFNRAALDRLHGRLALRFGTLDVAEGVAVRDGTAAIAIDGGTLTIADLKGETAGGALAASASLSQNAGGLALTTAIQVSGADLAHVSKSARGRAGFELTAEGQGFSPRALIDALSGSGNFDVAGGVHPAPSGALVAQTSFDVLTNTVANDVAVISETLKARLGGSTVALGDRRILFTLQNGALKADPIDLADGSGKVRAQTVIDLHALAIDSEWTVTAAAPLLPPPPGADALWKPAPKAPLPPIVLVYSGTVSDLAAVTAEIDPQALQQDLAARQMERKVEELEWMRRRDEERARLEQERRKAIEAERAAAAAARANPSAVAPNAELPPVPMPQPVPSDGNAPAPANGAAAPPPASSDAQAPENGVSVDDGAGAATAGANNAGDALPEDDAALSNGAVDPSLPDGQAGQVPRPPSTGATARPASATRPSAATGQAPVRQGRPRRTTTSDDIQRSLGGWP
ncbi:MAG: AsmA family protein [Hyphomicrobium sp.]